MRHVIWDDKGIARWFVCSFQIPSSYRVGQACYSIFPKPPAAIESRLEAKQCNIVFGKPKKHGHLTSPDRFAARAVIFLSLCWSLLIVWPLLLSSGCTRGSAILQAGGRDLRFDSPAPPGGRNHGNKTAFIGVSILINVRRSEVKTNRALPGNKSVIVIMPIITWKNLVQCLSFIYQVLYAACSMHWCEKLTWELLRA